MQVLIVSKTHTSNAACVGGLVLSNNQYVRLLNSGNYNQPTDTDFEIGHIWDLNFNKRINLHPPHIEDVIISSKTFVSSIDDMPNFIRQRNIIDWDGHIDKLFDNLLNWTGSGSGYIPANGVIPNKSVGFWVTDQDLIRATFDSKTRFRYPNGKNYRNIPYVGFQETLPTVPSGTILRVSLSRIFPPENSTIQTPKGYYLQLSGWYNDN